MRTILRYAAVLLVPAFVFPLAAAAQSPSTYEVKKGDTVLVLANKLKHSKATTNQMAYAIIHANMDIFGLRTAELWRPGATIKIPDEATVLKTDTKTADAYVASVRKSDIRYREALALEKKGDMNGAVPAYLDAAKIGHPLADLRLGQLYDKDRSGTLPRDLQESIKHYQAARKAGVKVAGPERQRIGEKPN
jgi:Tfp pilus assembly protein FimV